ncbi:hypothetical protein GCM10028784_08200 [Myceligenerans cantabricum]
MKKTFRTSVLIAGLAAGMTAGATSAAVAQPAQVACAATSAVPLAEPARNDPPTCEPTTTPITLGEPTPGATDDWQSTETDGVGYLIPPDWTGEAAEGDGGSGHEWSSPEVAVPDEEFGDLHWRVLVQSPFFDQEMPDPDRLNDLGFHASYIGIEGASEAVLVAGQGGHWWDGSVEIIGFEVYVRSETTGVVSRFMGELPAGAEGQFLLDNFVPTIQP